MKKLIPAVVVAAVLAVPAASVFAQASQQPVTRAQVRAELVELERAGYNPAANDIDYPQNLQAAQHRIEQERLAQGDTSGYGAPAGGTVAAGAPAAAQAPAHPAQIRPQDDIYGH